MIERAISKKFKQLSKTFPAVAVVGPRQSGKTTLVKAIFPDKPYALLEDPDTQAFATKDSRAFLNQFPKGAILDEVQRVPHLFSYLQGVLDQHSTPGQFILTGSQNFLLMEKITQSLAGRIALLTLLPFSLNELQRSGKVLKSHLKLMYQGFYPRLYKSKIRPKDLYANYVQTYLDRDVRLLKNVHDLTTFHTFLKMCAHRTGQLLNLSSLANDCSITHNTAKAWISLLEASYVIFLLRPHHKNFNKRLTKMPKLYFYDSGLACFLADIEDERHLTNHSLKGAMFESFIVSELIKRSFNKGEQPQLYFWRDKLGREVDCLREKGGKVTPIEIKSGQTPADDYFKNLMYYNGLSRVSADKSYVVYAGESQQKRKEGNLITWKDLDLIK